MSSSSVTLNQVVFQAPQFNETSGLLSRIQDEVGNVGAMFKDVQQLIAELNALNPPKPPGGNPPSPQAMAAYVQALQKYQQQVAALNAQIEDAQKKLGQAEAVLNRLQSQDLPQAEQRDRDRVKKAADDAQKALEDASKALEQRSQTTKSDLLPSIQVKIVEKKIDITLKTDPTFKATINAFALLSQMVGDATGVAKANRAVRMPPGFVGGGLPPIQTP
jgi:DNA repair exonuclease SbcCD ATPase subunit